MAKGTYVTSDIFEAAALRVYDCQLKKIMVDRSKERPEAIFQFDGSVEDYPAQYRDKCLIVDVRTFKRVMIELRKQMFEKIDDEES